jgi:hypothetical protein
MRIICYINIESQFGVKTMQITDEERQKLISLVEELRTLANNERQAGDLRRQQQAVKMRFYGHAEAYEDAAKRLEAIIGGSEQQAAKDTPLLDAGSKVAGKEKKK